MDGESATTPVAAIYGMNVIQENIAAAAVPTAEAANVAPEASRRDSVAANLKRQARESWLRYREQFCPVLWALVLFLFYFILFFCSIYTLHFCDRDMWFFLRKEFALDEER